MRKLLTAATVQRISSPATGRVEIHDSVVPALALMITSNGARSYVVRGRIGNRPQRPQNPIRVTLGGVDYLTLAEAREQASNLLRMMRRGEDPREARRVAAQRAQSERRTTFGAVAEAFISTHTSKLRSGQRVAADIRRCLVDPWGKQPINTITADDIADIVRAIIDEGKPAAAHRILATIKTLFGWAASPSRPREERLMVNPALTLTAKAFDLKPAPRQVALSEDHLTAIWQAAEQLDEPWRSFFHMLLLSGQRRGEVAGMLWSELDLNREHVWIIPSSRMKAGRSHEVPLTPTMVELLRKLPQRELYVFGRRLTDAAIMRAKTRLDALIGSDLPTYVIHDLRRAVRTGLGALPSVPHNIRELCIGHVPPVLTRTYDLHAYRDEKRQALTFWNERLARIVEPHTGTVTKLQSADQ